MSKLISYCYADGSHTYIVKEDKDVPPTYSYDMDEQVPCICCGKVVPYGDTYTSRHFMTAVTGFGYPVCGKCYYSGEELKDEGV